jgi:hypothetical protein
MAHLLVAMHRIAITNRLFFGRLARIKKNPREILLTE